MTRTSAALPHDEFLGTRRFGVLDGLRAIAILLVFTAHPRDTRWEALHGPTGVTLFFCLSGFLITTLLLREESTRGRVDFASFYVRRVFRIYPAFLGVFALYCVLILVVGLQPERRDVFVQNIPWVLAFAPEHMQFFVDGGVYPPFNGAWSIGIEEKFYLVWPLVGFALAAGWRAARVPVLVVVAVVSAVCGFSTSTLFLAPYQHLAFGALAAILLHQPRSYRRLAILGRPPVLSAVAILALVLQLSTAEVLIGGALYGADGLVLAAVLVGLVTTRTPAVRWLSSRPLVFLAAISYVFYLLHNLVLNAAEMVLPEPWGFPGSLVSSSIALVGSIAVSWAVHRVYEEPLRKYGVRLSRRLDGRRPPRPDAPAMLDPLAPGPASGSPRAGSTPAN